MMINDGRTVGITSPKDRSGLKDRWMGLSEDQLNGVEAEYIFKAQKKYLLGSVPSPLYWFNINFLLECIEICYHQFGNGPANRGKAKRTLV